MRESMGGSWLIGIVALFIVLFSGFIAYSVSYTKAFKTKNQIVNLIEKNEGFTYFQGDVKNVSNDELMNDRSSEAQAYYYIKQTGYNTGDISCEKHGYGSMQAGGYCLQRYCNNMNYTGVSGDARVYYKVTTFIKVNIPVINVGVNIPITGETKSLYYENSKVDINKLPCVDMITGY